MEAWSWGQGGLIGGRLTFGRKMISGKNDDAERGGVFDTCNGGGRS